MIAINWFNPLEGKHWPFVNVAFLFSFFVTLVLCYLVIPYGKRRPKGTPTSWGETMLGAVYTFGVMFLAFAIVPNQFILHADGELGWSRDKIIYGPFGILKPQSAGGWNPITLQYEIIRDTVVVLIHVLFFAIMIYLWKWWQSRGDDAGSKEIVTSTYGRPLVKKG